MKSKLIIIGSLIVLLVFGFLYSQKSNLIADDKDKKDCSSKCVKKSSSTENSSQTTDQNINSASAADDKNGYAVYEFVTNKISCDGCKPGMSEKLMGIAGVKEINYGETCNVSHMTNVKVYYSPTDTTPEVIAASVKENGLNCDQSKCGDGKKSIDDTKSEKKL